MYPFVTLEAPKWEVDWSHTCSPGHTMDSLAWGRILVLVVCPSHHFVNYAYLYVIILPSSGAGSIDSSDAALPKDSVLPLYYY